MANKKLEEELKTTTPSYAEAQESLQQAIAAKPTYANPYGSQLDELYNQIVNRDGFSYDANADAMYKTYRDRYMQQGKLAQMDTQGQAAALTGGYGSSYGQAVGQQMYDRYLQGLGDVSMDLRAQALDEYNQQGQQLLNNYGLLADRANDDYAKYQDAVTNYWNEVDLARGQADTAYNREWNENQREYDRQQAADEQAYGRQQDAYSRLVALISATGHMPTAEELAAGGMTPEEAQAWRDYYTRSITPTYYGGGGGGGSGYSSGGRNSGLTTAQREYGSAEGTGYENYDESLEPYWSQAANANDSPQEASDWLKKQVDAGHITTTQAKQIMQGAWHTDYSPKKSEPVKVDYYRRVAGQVASATTEAQAADIINKAVKDGDISPDEGVYILQDWRRNQPTPGVNKPVYNTLPKTGNMNAKK